VKSHDEKRWTFPFQINNLLVNRVISIILQQFSKRANVFKDLATYPFESESMQRGAENSGCAVIANRQKGITNKDEVAKLIWT